MKRSGRVPWVEVRVGVIILFAFAVLSWAAFNGTGMTIFEKSHELHAYFDDVSGLVNGSPVWLGGIEVGSVTKIEFVEQGGVGRVHIALKVTEDAWGLISDQSTVTVSSMGLMGDKYVSLSVRKPGEGPATPGATLQTDAGNDMSGVLASVPGLMDTLKLTLSQLNTAIGRIEKGEGLVGRLMTNSATTYEIDSLIIASKLAMRELVGTQRRLVASMETVAGSFDTLSYDLLHGNGTLSKLVYDSSLYVGLRQVTTRSDSLLAKWDSGPGTMGKLSSDSMLYVEVRDLVADTRGLIDDIMANPKKYFKFSVF
jgi:phospholipid/cholesterol/gamma-HCH transport system substrate-binding protein